MSARRQSLPTVHRAAPQAGPAPTPAPVPLVVLRRRKFAPPCCAPDAPRETSPANGAPHVFDRRHSFAVDRSQRSLPPSCAETALAIGTNKRSAAVAVEGSTRRRNREVLYRRPC